MIVVDVQAEHAALQEMVATSHGRLESMGLGQPHRMSCDYCGRLHVRAELEDVGMGVLMCGACRTQIDAGTRSGIFTFWELLDFVRLRPAPAASGKPVAVSVCLAPFSGLHASKDKAWWHGDKFWDRDKRMGDDLPNGLAWCREAVINWLKKPRDPRE